MKILVLGGSYFLGRWFVQYGQKQNEVTVINRGNVPIGLSTVKELKADRHDRAALMAYKDQEYDCIVDFCAYEKGDIERIVDIFGKPGKRYIFVSTVDVYKKGTGLVLNEESPIEDMHLPGPEGAYISGKIALEEELVRTCKAAGMEYCAVRPSILYGPANYAPREKLFFDMIKNGGRIVIPDGCEGRFQLMYVEEAANVILYICALPHPDKAYNICPEEICDYEIFAEALKTATGMDLEVLRMPADEILARGIPLPFPVSKEETEVYDGSKLASLNLKHIELSMGLKLAYNSL